MDVPAKCRVKAEVRSYDESYGRIATADEADAYTRPVLREPACISRAGHNTGGTCRSVVYRIHGRRAGVDAPRLPDAKPHHVSDFRVWYRRHRNRGRQRTRTR